MRTIPLLTIVLSVACTADPEGASDSVVVRVPAMEQTRVPGRAETPARADTIDATATQWTVEMARAAIAATLGTSVTVAGRTSQPFMSVPGAVLRAGETTIQIYVYGDAGARGRDTDVLDIVRVAPPATMITWREPPALVVDNNLAAIVLSRDESARRRIREALSGGHDPSHP